MKLTFLGTGTSFGVPQIGCHCAVCRSTDPRDRRSRVGAFVETDGGTHLLIDTPPELRIQLIQAGIDRVEFEVSTNPGAPFGPLTRIASGGELSRFILALKVALAEQGGAATVIFDEIDRGVGGAVASAIGERLARLASGGQLLAVTHSPQVAARGQTHYLIAKTSEGTVTRTSVSLLDPPGRQEEIARMLSGAEITSEARAQADRLLEGV